MSGRNAPRSKNGCSTCRRRKVKCGEERPVCKRCFTLHLTCEWGIPVKRGKLNSAVRYLQPAQPRWPVTTVTHGREPSISSTQVPYSPYSSSLTVISQTQTAADFSPIPLEALSPVSWPSLQTNFSIPPPLYPSLSGTDVACSNSLLLTEHDQKYFQFFPSSSVVFYYMKAWPWSSFRYLYQGPASSSKVIMRMILALSASDMHRNGLVVRPPGCPTAEDHARYHYGLAVKEFRQILESPQGPVSRTELEMIFATVFLMITYEWQFGHCVRHLELHLRGLKSLLESHPELFQIKDFNNVLMSMDAEGSDTSTSRVTFIPEQLLLWILYVDINCRPMGMKESLYNYVLQTGNPALHPDRLYRAARLWGRCFWGRQYPDQEVSDDMENYRALELLHVALTLRHDTWEALIDDSDQSRYQATELIFKEIMAIQEKFSDLFITAKFASPHSTRRTLNTIFMAASSFYAAIIFHRRLLYPPGPPAALHRRAVTNILEIVRKQHASDPRTLRRLHWPLLMAVIETEDVVQRDWLRERLRELREYHSEYLWANEIADEVLARQNVSQGRYADVADLLRHRGMT